MSLLLGVNYVGGREDGCGAFGSLWSMDLFQPPPTFGVLGIGPVRRSRTIDRAMAGSASALPLLRCDYSTGAGMASWPCPRAGCNTQQFAVDSAATME